MGGVRVSRQSVRFGWEFQNGIVPEWEWLLNWAFVKYFVGFGLSGSSILGIVELDVMDCELRF